MIIRSLDDCLYFSHHFQRYYLVLQVVAPNNRCAHVAQVLSFHYIFKLMPELPREVLITISRRPLLYDDFVARRA